MQKTDIRHTDKRRNGLSLPVVEGIGSAPNTPHNVGIGYETEHRLRFSEPVEGREPPFRFAPQRGPASVIYGPGSCPLFYTALLQQPRRLIWSAIHNTIACRVTLCEAGRDPQKGVEWSALAGNQDGYSWPVPDLALRTEVMYRWTIKPQNPMDLALQIPTLGLQDPMAEREARFWLLPTATLDRVRSGLHLLRERSDPEFLPLAEAMFLAEYQLYQYALMRLPLFDAMRNQSHSTLYETARSVIFRQMIQHMRQQPDLPTCFMDWATKNEQYHRRLTQEQLPALPSTAMVTSERYEQHTTPAQRTCSI